MSLVVWSTCIFCLFLLAGENCHGKYLARMTWHRVCGDDMASEPRGVDVIHSHWCRHGRFDNVAIGLAR